MFLIDKYSVGTNKLYFHKDVYKFLKNIAEDESMPHLLFNGPEGIGKKSMIKMFLNLLFGDDVFNTKFVKYTISGSGIKSNDETFLESNYHIEIIPKGNNNDRYLIQDVVKKYAMQSSFNLYNSKHNFKVIIIHNIHIMLPSVQFSLRRTIERYSDKCRFIIVASSINKVIKPLISRCTCIKLSLPPQSAIIYFSMNIARKENINLSLNRLTHILYNSNNLKDILWHLELYKTFDTYSNYINNNLDEIKNIIVPFNNNCLGLINNYKKTIKTFILKLSFMTKSTNNLMNTIGNDIFNTIKPYIIRNIDKEDSKYFENCKTFLQKYNKKTYKKIKFSTNKKIKLDENLLIIKDSLKNIFTALKLCTLKTNKEEILDKLVELILLKDIEMIDDIRNIYFNLMITNFSGTEIITNILSRIINNENISEKQKLDIIKICNDGEFNMGRGRREINQFDMIIVNIMNIMFRRF